LSPARRSIPSGRRRWVIRSKAWSKKAQKEPVLDNTAADLKGNGPAAEPQK
jgi:hypothetical protein